MKTYEVELSVLSNVHIGCNEKISKYEYVFNPKHKEVKVIDIRKVLAYVIENNKKDEYFNFISNISEKKNNSDWGLANFLEKNFSNSEELIEKNTVYNLEDCSEDYRLDDIDCFIKDKNTNMPYIPGSSLKGVISNAVYYYLTKFLIKSFNIYDIYSDENKSNIKTLDKVLKKIMQCFSVSDSELIGVDKLCVSKVYYFNVIRNRIKSLNQKYEMLKKGATTKHILKIDNERLYLNPFDDIREKSEKELYDTFIKKFTIEFLLKIIKSYNEMYQKFYLSKFLEYKNENPINVEDVQPNAVRIFVGAKTGFPNKTIYCQVYEEQAGHKIFNVLKEKFARTVKYDNIRHISPACLKVVKTGAEYYEMGAVQMKIKELNLV